MATTFLGEIKMIAFGFPPKGWAFCNGQLMPISQNQALFSLLGTNYGGDGVTTFALPDLRGRVPFHMGGGRVLGERGGESAHTLIASELPAHTHVPVSSSNNADAASPAGNVWASLSGGGYLPTSNTTLNPASVLPTSGSQPHENMAPYLALNFCIALAGAFPSQN